MKRNRNYYAGRNIYTKKKPGRNRRIRMWIVGVLLILLLAGMIFLMICGALYLRDKADERREKDMQQAYAEQPGPIWDGEKIPVLRDNDTKGPEGDEGDRDTQTEAKDPVQPQVSPGAPTPEPNSNGHELDDEMVIVIDAGHGGYDGGSSVAKVVEKDVNLAVAKEIARLLEEHGGITVVQTRDSDIHLSLQERSDIGNEVKCDYFVSIHCNTYEQDSSVHGLEVYYYEESKEGGKFAQGVIDDLKQYKDMKIRSARADTLAVTKHTYCPAILVEMGFLTNPTERANLADAEYQKKLAKRITDAILKTTGL